MYKKIILNDYEKDKFLAYTNAASSRFEVSVKFKVKNIKNVDYIYKLSKCVNETKELKRSVINGEIIEFDELNPAYVLLKDGEITSTFTKYSNDYKNFCDNYQSDYDLFLKSELKFCLKEIPQNCFHISSFKGYFDSFSLHLKNGFEYFQPIFTNFKNGDELIIYGNFHHAFFDLLRAKQFFDNLKSLF